MALTDERDYSQLLPVLPSPLASLGAAPAAPPNAPAPAATAAPADASTGYLRPIFAPSAKTQADQQELQRLQMTGSGVDQFQQKHHILGALARIGDVAGSILFPGAAAMIPGTTLHHDLLVNQAQGGLAQDVANDERQAQASDIMAGAGLKQSQTHKTDVDTALESQIEPIRAQAALTTAQASLLKAQNPDLQLKQINGPDGKPAFAAFNPKTNQFLDQSGTPIANATPYVAPTRSQGLPEILAQVGEPPDPAAYPQGKKDPKYHTDLVAWGKAYENLKNQEAEESGAAHGAGYNQFRPLPVFDPTTGTVRYEYASQAVTSGAAPSAEARHTLEKTALFNDMNAASENFRKALVNPDLNAFSPSQIAKIHAALSAENPTLMNREIAAIAAQGLTPAQQDFVTWLAQLQERALTLRSVAGMGQGSETTRNAILNALPSLASGDKGLALKQLDAFDNMVKNLEGGILHVNGIAPVGGENQQTGGEVMIQVPDGRKLMIPKANLQKAIQLGAKEVQQ